MQSLWAFSLYPEAAEGGGCLSVRRRRSAASGRPPNVERAQEEAARRARAKVRRYAAANRLNRLGTLTYRGRGLPRSRRAAGGSRRVLPRAARRAGRGPVAVCVGAAVASGRARAARALRGRPLRAARPDRARLGARLRAHQAARRAAGRLRRAGRGAARGPLPGPLRRAAISTTSAGWRGCIATRSRRASSRTRSSATASSAEDVIERASGVHGVGAGAGLAVVDRGGVAWAARLLGAVGLTI